MWVSFLRVHPEGLGDSMVLGVLRSRACDLGSTRNSAAFPEAFRGCSLETYISIGPVPFCVPWAQGPLEIGFVLCRIQPHEQQEYLRRTSGPRMRRLIVLDERPQLQRQFSPARKDFEPRGYCALTSLYPPGDLIVECW